MKRRPFLSSLARITDLDREDWSVERRDRNDWRTGDYVLVEVIRANGTLARVELDTGRITSLFATDLVVGALGARHATLEAVGSWENVLRDGRMHLLTSAGLLGRATSVSGHLLPLVVVEYRGHVVRDGTRLTMSDFRIPPPERASVATNDEGHGDPATHQGAMRAGDAPVLLIVGTSMSAGKTSAAKAIIRRLVARGLRVVGTKLTGAGRYQDILAMRDAGAVAVADFVDAGLPSSIASAEDFRDALGRLFGAVRAARPDLIVAEAGASPLEPYNGDTLLDELRGHVRSTIVCASDPYAVVGVRKAFGLEPDLIAGIATSTSAGVELIERLTRVPALNVVDPSATAELDAFLERVVPSSG